MPAAQRIVDRRHFLGFLAAAPTLTAAALLLDGALLPPAGADGVDPQLAFHSSDRWN